jgi:hypothetical protein
MRKWAWSCLALVVLAVAGVYLAADHAARHPDSFIGRCAITATRLTSRISPIVLVRATNVLPCRSLAECRTTAPDTAGDILAPCSHVEPIVVDIVPLQSADLGLQIDIEEAAIRNPQSATTPVFMPYADEGTEQTCLLDFLGCRALVERLFSRAAGTEDVSQIDVPVAETSQQAVTPAVDVDEIVNQLEGVQQPRLYEDPHYHHYPCCPYSGRCPQPYPTRYPVLPRADEPEMNPTQPDNN